MTARGYGSRPDGDRGASRRRGVCVKGMRQALPGTCSASVACGHGGNLADPPDGDVGAIRVDPTRISLAVERGDQQRPVIAVRGAGETVPAHSFFGVAVE